MKKNNQARIEEAVKEYNRIMANIGCEYNTIGIEGWTEHPEEKAQWTLRDMVAEVDYWLGTHYEGGHLNAEPYGGRGRNIRAMKQFIKKYEAEAMQTHCHEGHLSEYDDWERDLSKEEQETQEQFEEAIKNYTGEHFVGEITHHREHEVIVTDVWNVDGKNGISIKPTGDYGFEVDIYEEQLEKPKAEETNFVYSDGGRSKYFKADKVGDCVVRAIANATGKDYKAVYDDINELSKRERTGSRKLGKSSARNGVYKSTIKKYIEGVLGWSWFPTMAIGSGCQTHLTAEELPKGVLIVSVSKHLTCVKDGVIYDTFDCSRNGTRCVYGYWAERSKA